MNSLEQFLALPDVDKIVDEVDVSERLTQALGKFKVKAMSQEDFRNYQKQAVGRIDKKGADFDIGKFNLLIVEGQTIYPNFKDAELCKKAGCALPSDLISKKLLAGEIVELSRKIQELSGFDRDTDEDIKEAKN